MRFTLTGQLPRHIYTYVDTSHTHVQPVGFIPAVWFGLVSYPGRAWGCTVMLESGAVYRNLPPHAIAFSETPEAVWEPKQSQHWDCYSWDFATLEYDYLRGLDCKVKANCKDYLGQYLFSATPVGDGFTAATDQNKEFSFIRLDNDRLTTQPTNHIVFQDRSFTDGKMEFPKGLKRQTEVWSVE